jgi:hypothetical protein
VIGVLVVSARLYTRLFLTRAAGLDDACIVIALAFGIALSVLVIIGNKVWWSGHHIWDIPISKFSDHRFNIWCAEWCYVISTSCTKISVLLFYRRISIKFSKAFIIATWAGIVYNILYMIAFALVLLLLCSPISAYWNSFNVIWVMTHPNFKCGAENIELPLSGVFSVIGDFYSALLPILVIFNLNLSRRQKWSLYALFSLAFLIVAAGIARTILMWQMMNEIYDFTWGKLKSSSLKAIADKACSPVGNVDLGCRRALCRHTGRKRSSTETISTNISCQPSEELRRSNHFKT